jgi:hypothetical protein
LGKRPFRAFGLGDIGGRAGRGGEKRAVLLPEDVVKGVGVANVEGASLLDGFADAAEEFG